MKNHVAKECKAPGGLQDPNYEESWVEYRKRRAELYNPKVFKPAPKAEQGNSSPTPQQEQQKGESKGKSGKDGGKKGKGKSKGKGKGKGKGKDRAEAVLDDRVSAVQAPQAFPRNAIGLDSWANVHLIHQKRSKSAPELQHTISLAYGETKCNRDVGRKGVPGAYVPWRENGENMDLFPEGFLWERGCEIARGNNLTITTPKNRVFTTRSYEYARSSSNAKEHS